MEDVITKYNKIKERLKIAEKSCYILTEKIDDFVKKYERGEVDFQTINHLKEIIKIVKNKEETG